MGEVKVWGSYDGRGLVILSDEPVDFHPTNKTSNVVMVDVARRCGPVRQRRDPDHRRVPLATARRELRDRLASAGGAAGRAGSEPPTGTCPAARTTRCSPCSASSTG